MSSTAEASMTKWTAIGTVLQTAMVVVGHWVAFVALYLFAPLGMLISLVVGALYAKDGVRGYGAGALGGAIVGGVCALIGIGISVALGDVPTSTLWIGTVASTVTGLIGGLIGVKLSPRTAGVA